MAPPRGVRVRARPAAAPRYGLLASLAGTLTDTPDRWETGISWDPESCAAADVDVVDRCGAAALSVPVPADEREAVPFGVWAGERCSPWDLGRDWQGRALRQLAANRSAIVERELWTGALAQAAGYSNAFLADAGDADVLTAGAVTPLEGLEILEDALGRLLAGGRGMIHATPSAVTAWANGGALRRDGNVVVTTLDTIVVPGSGYPGTGPGGTGPAAGSVWAYGTDMVAVRLGEPFVVPGGDTAPGTNVPAQGFDRASNTVVVYAWQAAVATFDGCAHVAAQLNLPAAGLLP